MQHIAQTACSIAKMKQKLRYIMKNAQERRVLHVVYCQIHSDVPAICKAAAKNAWMAQAPSSGHPSVHVRDVCVNLKIRVMRGDSGADIPRGRSLQSL
jgi:hypothetical protein